MSRQFAVKYLILLETPDSSLSHEEGVDVLSDHSLERGSTGHLVFRNPLQQFQLRKDDGSQIRTFGCDLPAMPPSRTPPASGAAPSAMLPDQPWTMSPSITRS
jgi:hypothetical protein